MKSTQLQTNLLLLLTALIWGFAFVAQSKGMDFVGPFTFNGVRFPLGALSLVPLILWFDHRSIKTFDQTGKKPVGWTDRNLLKASIIAGLLLFGGTTCQQFGIIGTTAGNAGFITGLYVVAVPICGLFLGQRTGWQTWLGAITAVIGLYILAFRGGAISQGDFLVLIGVLFWTTHVLVIDHFAAGTDAIKLACYQFAIAGLLSLICALIFETILLNDIWDAAMPIAYAAFLSTGVAYTLQVVAQKTAHPAHASIILSMEAAFAVLGGWLLLNEAVTARILWGCAIMLAGMLISQLGGGVKEKESRRYD